MSFTFVKAVRRNTHLLIGIAGASGSGKTFSALEMATGLAGHEGKIAFIDSEAARALHYADRFAFDHCDLQAPFPPQKYLDAIEAAEKAGYAVIVVDSFSHVHAGTGGLIEWAEEELKKPNMRSPANWAAPKAAYKRLMNRLLQCRAHIILCMRADEKIRIEKVMDERTGREKTVVVQAGWQPICEKTTMYEMVVSFVMSPESPGVPIEGSGKIQDQHRFAFPVGQRVSQETGRLLAEWASGAAQPEDAAVGSSETSALIIEGDGKALEGLDALRVWWESIPAPQKRALGAKRGDSGPHMVVWKSMAENVAKAAGLP